MAELFLNIQPYKKGYLPVGQGHELYFELCGNPNGRPVLFVHGGPGAGCSKNARRFFDPKIFNAILFDQRGAGKSKPSGSLKANKTKNLVEDIRKLLKRLGIKKVFLFGGSWGSTLALCYAIKYPKTVAGMLLRGIFLANRHDTEFTYTGAAKEIFPEEYEKLFKLVPKRQQKNFLQYYSKRIASKKKGWKKFASAFVEFENSIMTLRQKKEKRKKSAAYFAFGAIESFFLANNCFLPENYIFKNAHKLSGIPTTIVHGRYDLVCPASSALALHKAIKGSRLFFTIAGHASREQETRSRLVQEMERAGKTIKW